MTASPAVKGILGLLTFVGLSQGVSATTELLPSALEVLTRAVHLGADPSFLASVGSTVRAWLTGMAIAVVMGVAGGLVLRAVPAIQPLLEFARPIPSVALIPLVSLVLGAGLRTEVTLIVYAATWPILFNTLYGLRHADPVPAETLRVFGFGRAGVLWRVSLPAAAPFIATGIRLAAAVALILAVGTEILAGFGDGLGVFIAQAEQVVDGTTDVLAGTVWAGTLGLLANLVLTRAERAAFPWRSVS